MVLVSAKSGVGPIETIKSLVGETKIWAFSESSQNKENMSIGDSICFYAAEVGIIADAK